MSAPVRIQLSRAKGWRMPPNTVKVDRTTRWGNLVRVGEPHPSCTEDEIAAGDPCAAPMTAADAVAIFRCFYWAPGELEPLRGKNLACWCKPGAPCHADVLLELANRTPEQRSPSPLIGDGLKQAEPQSGEPPSIPPNKAGETE